MPVVLPVSFFEREENVTYNSVAVIDGDGAILGAYRKTHIPDDHFYQEKFYFTPGNTGFRVWDTLYAKIGVGICWCSVVSGNSKVYGAAGSGDFCFILRR